jgi:hypothetical protein
MTKQYTFADVLDAAEELDVETHVGEGHLSGPDSPDP